MTMNRQIVIVVDKLIRGGGETLLRSLLKKCDSDLDFQIWNIGKENKTVVDELEETGAVVIHINNYSRKEKYIFLPLIQLIPKLRQFRPDIVHGYSNYTNILARIAGSVIEDTSVIGQHHGVPASAGIEIWANVVTNRLGDSTITVSDAVNNAIYGEEGTIRRKIAGDEIKTIHNGIDLKQARSFTSDNPDLIKSDLQIPEHAFIVSNVGRLIPAKNQSTIIKSIGKLSGENIHLIIIGDGPLYQDLNNIARDLGISDRVHLLGRWPREDTLKFISVSDIFISTSIREGFGISYIEAMALGLPTIVSMIPAYQEVGNPEVSEFVPPNNINILSDSIEKLASNEALRNEYSQNATLLVESKFSLKKMVDEYMNIYHQL